MAEAPLDLGIPELRPFVVDTPGGLGDDGFEGAPETPGYAYESLVIAVNPENPAAVQSFDAEAAKTGGVISSAVTAMRGLTARVRGTVRQVTDRLPAGVQVAAYNGAFLAAGVKMNGPSEEQLTRLNAASGLHRLALEFMMQPVHTAILVGQVGSKLHSGMGDHVVLPGHIETMAAVHAIPAEPLSPVDSAVHTVANHPNTSATPYTAATSTTLPSNVQRDWNATPAQYTLHDTLGAQGQDTITFHHTGPEQLALLATGAKGRVEEILFTKHGDAYSATVGRSELATNLANDTVKQEVVDASSPALTGHGTKLDVRSTALPIGPGEEVQDYNPPQAGGSSPTGNPSGSTSIPTPGGQTTQPGQTLSPTPNSLLHPNPTPTHSGTPGSAADTITVHAFDHLDHNRQEITVSDTAGTVDLLLPVGFRAHTGSNLPNLFFQEGMTVTEPARVMDKLIASTGHSSLTPAEIHAAYNKLQDDLGQHYLHLKYDGHNLYEIDRNRRVPIPPNGPSNENFILEAGKSLGGLVLIGLALWGTHARRSRHHKGDSHDDA